MKGALWYNSIGGAKFYKQLHPMRLRNDWKIDGAEFNQTKS